MASPFLPRLSPARMARRLAAFPAVAGLLTAVACAPATVAPTPEPVPAGNLSTARPNPDPRVGLRAGMHDAQEAVWNLRVVSKTPPAPRFAGSTNSDLAFSGPYAIQGNYNGFMVWDISNPAKPVLATDYYCPASQSDVSVYRNLLFVSGEGTSGRLDCGDQGVPEPVSHHRLRGVRIFDITDIRNPKYIANVQTCRGSHTHTVLEDPKDKQNVYIYVSGSAGVRPADELPGCSGAMPNQDPNSALFRIEVIRVPLANPQQAAIVSSPRIFNDLVAPPRHGETPQDIAEQRAELQAAKARGAFTGVIGGRERVIPGRFLRPMLDSIVKANGRTTANAADSAALRAMLPDLIARTFGRPTEQSGPEPGPTQCHDITVYPAIGLAGGACEGYGLLLDIRDPVNPVRVAAVADSNFSYWHSATFSNDGSKVLFSDEWGGGGQPKCRAADPKEGGANAIFRIVNGKMEFQEYYKMPAAQTSYENCVAHNGSLIPIPGREVMVQAWYQGGISVFDWTDPKNPVEIAFHDRGPSDATTMGPGGSWSVYWYNGSLVSSEIARGLDIFELVPSGFISQNEIDASKTVRLDYFNPQGQPQFAWPATFSLARAYVDQLERSRGLSADRIAAVRTALRGAESASGTSRRNALTQLATQLDGEAAASSDAAKVRTLAKSVRDLAAL